MAKEAKPIPAHVIAQRAGERNKAFRGHNQRSESYDVFRRINMHDGSKDVCWEWRGAHGLGTRGEYRPRVRIKNKDLYVHRVVYELYTGYTLLPRDVIRHQCDNSWCCNPHHMLIGSQADNVRDMLERERVGMKQYQIKQLMQLLEEGDPSTVVQRRMRELYGISIDVTVIRKIKMRQLYKHIEWPWGEEFVKFNRARIDKLKAQKLAGDIECDIIQSTTTQKDTTNDKAKSEAD